MMLLIFVLIFAGCSKKDAGGNTNNGKNNEKEEILHVGPDTRLYQD